MLEETGRGTRPRRVRTGAAAGTDARGPGGGGRARWAGQHKEDGLSLRRLAFQWLRRAVGSFGRPGALLRGVRGWRTARPGPGDRLWRTGTGLADPGPAAGHGDGEGGPACRPRRVQARRPGPVGRLHRPAPASARLRRPCLADGCGRAFARHARPGRTAPGRRRPARSLPACKDRLAGPERQDAARPRAGLAGWPVRHPTAPPRDAATAAARRPRRLAGSPPDGAASRCGDGGRRAWTPARRHSRATRTRPPGRPRAPVPRPGRRIVPDRGRFPGRQRGAGNSRAGRARAGRGQRSGCRWPEVPGSRDAILRSRKRSEALARFRKAWPRGLT